MNHDHGKEELLVEVLEDAIKRIKSGNCGLDDTELEQLATLLGHYKVTEEQVCQRKHFSRATLSRRIQTGQFPEPHKDAGGKKYYFWNEVKDLQ